MREKLIELLNNSFDEQYSKRGLLTAPHTAEHLIANGVTFAEDNNVPSKWIPVTERLPDSSGMFIVTVEKLYGVTYSDVTYFDALSKKWGTNTHHYSCDKVTHWMPIPEPQKET